MSTELIKAVYIKPGGVYLYSKSSNDGIPFREWKCDSLTDVYQTEGQRGLDREMVRMFCEYAEIRGHHPSVERYRPCLRDGAALREAFSQSVQIEYIKLTQKDIASIWFTEDKQTPAAKAYLEFRHGAENELYTKLAGLTDNAIHPHTKKDIAVIKEIHNLCGVITSLPMGKNRADYIKTQLSQIGKSAARLSDEFRDATRDEIKWGFVRALSGIKDFCDEQTLREITENDIPVLQNFCERALEKHREDNGRKRSNDDLSR